MEYIGNIIYDELLKEKGIELVIFGAGRYGKRIYDFLDMNGMADNIKYFCDKNEMLWGRKSEGIEIVDPMQVIASKATYHFLVGGRYVKEILMLLQENEVEKIHLLFI